MRELIKSNRQYNGQTNGAQGLQFCHIIELSVAPGQAKKVIDVIGNEAIPRIIQPAVGFIDEMVLLALEEQNHVTAFSFWRSKEDSDRFDEYGFAAFTGLLEQSLTGPPERRPFWVGASTNPRIRGWVNMTTQPPAGASDAIQFCHILELTARPGQSKTAIDIIGNQSIPEIIRPAEGFIDEIVLQSLTDPGPRHGLQLLALQGGFRPLRRLRFRSGLAAGGERLGRRSRSPAFCRGRFDESADSRLVRAAAHRQGHTTRQAERGLPAASQLAGARAAPFHGTARDGRSDDEYVPRNAEPDDGPDVHVRPDGQHDGRITRQECWRDARRAGRSHGAAVEFGLHARTAVRVLAGNAPVLPHPRAER
jgi:hypothetical protein